MQDNNTTPPNETKEPESKTLPNDGLPPAREIVQDEHKEEVKEEVKESFKEEGMPGEPVLSDDGDEVGGEE